MITAELHSVERFAYSSETGRRYTLRGFHTHQGAAPTVLSEYRCVEDGRALKNVPREPGVYALEDDAGNLERVVVES
jgi:hypothetical protein